ncbi:VOC family protein [Bacillaceae bacterium SIJ1]|uniref:glyoxalase superfamily protein n=1 Tax=Litoribacterium kuwaitense TaxID=1398745 RepID=UPI0013EA05AA|nr:glyoxalase superfamily protein [Litoribacterium kuwaitense]NGP45242.1 VOC family protein [Litoribacterium kuwaitense]
MLDAPVPILRFFDEERTFAFYERFLGFTVDWTHRFEEGLPLYMQVSQGKCVLHLSEHYGDAIPGSTLRIGVEDVEAFQQALLRQQAAFARPGLQDGVGGKECIVTDPSGNRLIFFKIE